MRSTAILIEDEYEEVTVSSIEVLEAHFGALRADVDELKIDFREFRKEFSVVVARIDRDIKDAVSKLQAEIRDMAAKAQSDVEKLAARMDKQYDEIRGDIKATNEKLVVLDKKVDGIDSKLTAFFWVVGLLITGIGALITVGHAFHWF